MSDNQEPAILTELRSLQAGSEVYIDEQAYRRLMLAAVSGVYDRIAAVEGSLRQDMAEISKKVEAGHTHPITDAAIEELRKTTNVKDIIAAVVSFVSALAVAKLWK